jgi:hypothetical protein
LQRTEIAANLSDEELSARFKEGLPVHIEAQKEIYAFLSQPKSLQSILDFKPMAKSAWVPVIFNLINLKLAKVFGEREDGGDGDPEFSDVDDIISEAYIKLVEPSGLLKYGHFLLLARSELTRYQSTEIPFSVAVVKFESLDASLPDNVLTGIADCFYEACQPIDVLSVKDARRLFILLPHSEETIAANTMQKFLKNLFVAQLPNGMNGSGLGIRIGVASVPTDGDDFIQLLVKANGRCNQATSGQPLAVS